MTAAITDFNQYTDLRTAAGKNDPAALREVAGQFEALFLQTMLKNMREASLGDPLFGDNDQHKMFQGMMDQQLSLEMASGNGIGLADMLVRQLGADSEPKPGGKVEFDLSGIARTTKTTRAAPITAIAEQPDWSDAEKFAHDLWPHAERAARRLNVAPEAVLAQAALETGWGAHVMQNRDGSSSFNLFGIKAAAGWSGDSVSRSTLEFEGGVPRREIAQFRAYEDVAASFDDYVDMISTNPRYELVGGHGSDVGGFATALQESGYATDPAYADKLRNIAQGETMKRAMHSLKTGAEQPITTRLVAESM